MAEEDKDQQSPGGEEGTPPPSDPPASDATQSPEDEEVESLVDLLIDLYKDDSDDESDKPANGEGGDNAPSSSAPPPGTTDPPGSPPPQTVDLSKVDWNDPQNRKYLLDEVGRIQASQELEANQQKLLDDVRSLIRDGKYEDLGKIFAQEWVATESQTESLAKARPQVLRGLYEQLYSDPVFKTLTPEELAEVDPKNYQWDGRGDWDMSYIQYVQAKIAAKKVNLDVEKVVEERVAEALKAKGYEETGNRVRNPSPSNSPPASGGAPATDDDSKSGSDLIFEGLREAYLGSTA